MATVAGSSFTQPFVVTAGTTTQTLACSSGAPQTPAAGGVLPGVSGTGICLGAAAGGSDYALVAFFGNPNQATLGQVNVTAHGATALTTPDLVPLGDVFANPQRGPSLGGGGNEAQEQFDLRLRRIAQTQLAPLVPGARAAMRSGARFNAIPSSLTLNQIVPLNANGVVPCSSPINIGARVAAISNTAYRPRRHGQSDRRLHRRRVRVVRDDVRHAHQSARRAELRPADGHRSTTARS